MAAVLSVERNTQASMMLKCLLVFTGLSLASGFVGHSACRDFRRAACAGATTSDRSSTATPLQMSFLTDGTYYRCMALFLAIDVRIVILSLQIMLFFLPMSLGLSDSFEERAGSLSREMLYFALFVR